MHFRSAMSVCSRDGLECLAKSFAQRFMTQWREFNPTLWHLTLRDVIKQMADQGESAAPLIIEIDQRPG